MCAFLGVGASGQSDCVWSRLRQVGQWSCVEVLQKMVVHREVFTSAHFACGLLTAC